MKPPPSRMPLTPNDPKLSTLPYPLGNRSDGGFKDQETVASVIMSLTRSVRLWMASAMSALGSLSVEALSQAHILLALTVEGIATCALADCHA